MSDAPKSDSLSDMLEQRIRSAGAAIMAQMQDDIDGNSLTVLVLPIYSDPAGPRCSLRLLTIIDGKTTETHLGGSYRTYKAARKAANFVEAAARVILRQLRPISMAGAEQAIYGSPDYCAAVALKVTEADKEPPCSPTSP